MENCIFCKIATKEIPSEIIYEDENMLAFKDITPVAPIHILFIPKTHISSFNDLNNENINIIGEMLLKVKKVAKELGISENGYRIVNNCGKDGGQTVNHLHFHLLAGRELQWPPG